MFQSLWNILAENAAIINSLWYCSKQLRNILNALKLSIIHVLFLLSGVILFIFFFSCLYQFFSVFLIMIQPCSVILLSLLTFPCICLFLIVICPTPHSSPVLHWMRLPSRVYVHHWVILDCSLLSDDFVYWHHKKIFLHSLEIQT